MTSFYLMFFFAYLSDIARLYVRFCQQATPYIFAHVDVFDSNLATTPRNSLGTAMEMLALQ